MGGLSGVREIPLDTESLVNWTSSLTWSDTVIPFQKSLEGTHVRSRIYVRTYLITTSVKDRIVSKGDYVMTTDAT